jgi:hypothetical protein
MFAKHILGREPPQGSQPEDKSVTRDSFPVPNKLMPENRSSPGAETIPSRFDGKGARGRPLPNKSVRRIPIARYLNYSAMSKRPLSSRLQRPEVPTFDKVDPNPIRPYRMVLVQADMPKMLEHSCSLPFQRSTRFKAKPPFPKVLLSPTICARIEAVPVPFISFSIPPG